MKIVMNDVSLLRDSLDAISGIVNEATFEFTSNGLGLKAIDPAVVAMTILKMAPSCFDQYDLGGDVKLTVNLDYLLEVLKRVKPSDKVIIELIADAGNLKISMIGNLNREFKIGLIENPDKEQKVPAPEFSGQIIIDNNVLRDAVKNCQMVSDCATFSASPEKFSISASGDLNNVVHDLTKDSPYLKELSVLSEESSKYSLEYLEKIIRGDKVSADTIIKFKKDYLLQVEYKTPDKLSLIFILAPRVEND
ncbi:MAG: DNA polymerase sliding clamp [Candidatus Nanoarchaeia archaeon]|nr:DNA polymerase sliding clamp [Candidatus Nanoarchaeia archaeon]MDD5053817.1 DNA polymerase sliding clamp [Candidatus Nanoarchaeia archaeon]MDD5499473.1 DNA polymerase sliding clamp [Candidatus Nanoarchaeia archaeon]